MARCYGGPFKGLIVYDHDHDEHLVARLEERVTVVQRSIAELRDALRDYVRMERYLRVEVAVFGIIGVVMSALLIYALNKIVHP